ncbi:hypothetical protein WJX77_003509 [Trebouxia sp. C0004]
MWRRRREVAACDGARLRADSIVRCETSLVMSVGCRSPRLPGKVILFRESGTNMKPQLAQVHRQPDTSVKTPVDADLGTFHTSHDKV